MGSKLVAPHMVEREYGRISSITSIQGFAAIGDAGAYNAAKGGIIAYTKPMAVELGRYNILVNAIAHLAIQDFRIGMADCQAAASVG